jgi:hypothetical protein
MMVALFRDVADDDLVAKILEACPDAPVSFFAELRTTILAERSETLVRDFAADLSKVVKESDRHLQSLEAKLRSSGKPPATLIELARDEWAMRQRANISYLED